MGFLEARGVIVSFRPPPSSDLTRNEQTIGKKRMSFLTKEQGKQIS